MACAVVAVWAMDVVEPLLLVLLRLLLLLLLVLLLLVLLLLVLLLPWVARRPEVVALSTMEEPSLYKSWPG